MAYKALQGSGTKLKYVAARGILHTLHQLIAALVLMTRCFHNVLADLFL